MLEECQGSYCLAAVVMFCVNIVTIEKYTTTVTLHSGSVLHSVEQITFIENLLCNVLRVRFCLSETNCEFFVPIIVRYSTEL